MTSVLNQKKYRTSLTRLRESYADYLENAQSIPTRIYVDRRHFNCLMSESNGDDLVAMRRNGTDFLTFNEIPVFMVIDDQGHLVFINEERYDDRSEKTQNTGTSPTSEDQASGELSDGQHDRVAANQSRPFPEDLRREDVGLVAIHGSMGGQR